MPNDYQGRPVPENEPDDKVILVWTISPHPMTDEYSHLVCRSWQDMLDTFKYMDIFLEQLLEKMTVGQYKEIEECE